MVDRRVAIGQRWRHYKGGEYNVICLAKLEATGEDMVVYHSIEHGGRWIRPLSEFLGKVDGYGSHLRFELMG